MTLREYTENRAAHLGPFQRGGALVSGELEFVGRTSRGADRKHQVEFATEVWIFNENRVGAPAPPSYQYHVKFEVDGSSYQRRVPTSHVLKPQEADRFTIKIGMDKSSEHRFRLKLLYNQTETRSYEIVMKTFVPRSGVRYLTESRQQQDAGTVAGPPSDGTQRPPRR